jgi:hypothetical protein
MVMEIINSSIENPQRCFDVINFFRPGGAIVSKALSLPASLCDAWGKSAFPLADNRVGARSFIASCFILGMGWDGVKAPQSNTSPLAFCHPPRLPLLLMKADHLALLLSFGCDCGNLSVELPETYDEAQL